MGPMLCSVRVGDAHRTVKHPGGFQSVASGSITLPAGEEREQANVCFAYDLGHYKQAK